MLHKTNGTNEKLVPQGFISAQKQILFYHLPPHNGSAWNWNFSYGPSVHHAPLWLVPWSPWSPDTQMDYPNSIVSFTLMLIVWKNYSLVQLSLTLNLALNSIQENLISKHCILFWGHPVHRTLSVSVTHDYRSNVPYVLYSCGQKYIIFFARYLLILEM